MIVVDDFLPDAAGVRAAALRVPYIDWPGYDGEVYKRVWLGEVPGLQAAIERQMGPVEMFGQGYRLNFAGELPNHSIHSDMGWGTHAAVVYLCDGPGGTAFWRHKATGATSIKPGDLGLLAQIEGDWDDESRWDMTAICPLKFGRAVIYDGSLFHSRYPFAAFGTGPEDGRLVAVAFFTPKEPR